jgi:hypothetical protein
MEIEEEEGLERGRCSADTLFTTIAAIPKRKQTKYN